MTRGTPGCAGSCRGPSRRMIRRFEDDVQRVAAQIVDDLLVTGPCEFVEHVAAGCR